MGKMNQTQKDILAQAILNEVEGYEFYKLAANQAPSEASRKSFMELGNEELKHIEFIKSLGRKLNGEEISVDEFLGEEPPSPEIYTWDKYEKEQLQMAIAVYSIGIQMEKDSIKFYSEAKEKFDTQEAKDLFDLLIQWETVHLEQFQEQYDIYKEAWWGTQQFAPF